MAFMGPQGGGKALPPYLQGRNPVAATQPMITPKSSVVPGEVAPPPVPKPATAATPAPSAAPAITPAGQTGPINPAGAAAAQAKAAAAPQSLYEFFKNDLERNRDAAIANARSDASKRGVFYGTPLTTSQGDIQTEFQRGLGSLQGSLMQNQEQNQMERLRMAIALLGSGNAEAAGIDPGVMQTIGALLTPRAGPAITPAPQRGNKTQGMA